MRPLGPDDRHNDACQTVRARPEFFGLPQRSPDRYRSECVELPRGHRAHGEGHLMMSRLTRSRRSTWLVAVAAVMMVVVAVWLLWPTSEPELPRARQYVDVNLCLLTAERGLAEPDAVPVWAGMQDVSTATHVRVQYLAVAGAQTVANARTFVASLAQARCAVVLAAGDVPVAAVAEAAPTFTAVRFVTVGGNPGPNITVVSPSPSVELQRAIAATLTPLVTP